MHAVTTAALLLALLTPAAAFAQSPASQFQNGKVEVRTGTAIDREIAAVSAAGSVDPVWLAWKVPLIDGDRDLCSNYQDRLGAVRGQMLTEGVVTISDGIVMTNPRPQITPAPGPIPLEGGTSLVVLIRAVGGQVERLRTIGDDCPVDAGGRTVYWLSGVSSAESLRYLNALARQKAANRTLVQIERNTEAGAVRALGYHRDAAANALLDELATNHPDPEIRRQAASTLGASRGAFGVTTLKRLIASETNATTRRSLVAALGQSREAAAVDALRTLTRDADAGIRAAAASLFVLCGGIAVVPEALKIVESDPDEGVKRRTVAAIGRLPGDAGLTHLIQVARTSASAVARKEAVSAISNSKDPRAIAFLEEILKGR